MFSFIADILTSITSILFPIFASYKALRTSDPAVLTPWLMYWVTLSLILLAESWLYFILYWVPFYAWIRFGVHLYLVLPGKQGSVLLYQEYIHPFLEEHERQIDHMISDAHEKAKAAGLDAMKRAIEYVRVNFLGMAPKQPSPQPSRNVSYSTYLMDRFVMPSARQGLATAGTSDVFSLIGKALQQTTYPDSTTREAQAADLAQSGSLIPPSLSGEERTDYISTQRERLTTLLQAFDATEAAGSFASARPAPPPRQPSARKSYPMDRSMHDSEYDDLAYEAMPDPEDYHPGYEGQRRHRSRREEEDRRRDVRAPAPGERRRSDRAAPPAGGGGWGSWGSSLIWGNYGEKDSAIDPRKDR